MKKYFYISFIFILPLISCEDKPPVEESKFVRVYANLISAPDSLVTDTLSFSEFKKQVFRKFKVTEKDYASMISYYNEEPERWTKFFDRVINYIESSNDSSNLSF